MKADPRAAGLGFGLGLRPAYYQALLGRDLNAAVETAVRPPVDWLEIISENHLDVGGRPAAWLEAVRADYPLVMHGVGLSIGGTDPLDLQHIRGLRQLAEHLQVAWISDHLCWTGVDGIKLHDLLPLPLTEAVLQHVVDRVKQVQDLLGRRLVLENVSSYLRSDLDTYAEADFLAALAERADCLLLLDINNIWVSAHHGGMAPEAYLATIPVQRVQQFHLAGQAAGQTLNIDTHDGPVSAPVWALYAAAVQRFGLVSTLLERDAALPPWSELLDELSYARQVAAGALPTSPRPRLS